MKKWITILAVLAMAFVFGACSMSMDTHKYMSTNKEIQTGECTVSIADPVPEIPAKVTKIKILEPVMFDWDKSDIRIDQRPIIHRVAAMMTVYPDTVLVLDAYASVEGAEDYNINLSADRAQSVEAALVAEGVPADRIHMLRANGETVLTQWNAIGFLLSSLIPPITAA